MDEAFLTLVGVAKDSQSLDRGLLRANALPICGILYVADAALWEIFFSSFDGAGIRFSSVSFRACVGTGKAY